MATAAVLGSLFWSAHRQGLVAARQMAEAGALRGAAEPSNSARNGADKDRARAQAQANFESAESTQETLAAVAAFLGLAWTTGVMVWLRRTQRRLDTTQQEARAQLERETAPLRAALEYQRSQIEALTHSEKSARERERFLQQVLSNTPIVLWAMDRDGVFTLREGKALADLGQKPGQGVGRPSAEVMQGYDDFPQYTQRAMSGETFSAETMYQGRWYNTRFNPWRGDDGRIIGVTGVSTDITARKSAEQVAISEEGARQASRLKSEFLSSMSHELRTPMNGIVGTAGLLNQTPLTDAQRGMLNVIQASADSLLVVVNDILDLSKLEAGKFKLEPASFDPRKLVEDLLAVHGAQAHAKGLELINDFDASIPGGLVGDGDRIRQVVANLIGNAIKFSAHGHVLVQVRKTAQKGDKAGLRFEISDTGVGLSSEQQKSLFQPFSGGEGANARKVGAAGLGLALAKHIVELMGGSIGVTSELGAGSTFWIELELPVSAGAPPVTGLTLLNGKRLLVVDDNKVSRGILALQLAAKGAAVDTAPDSATALSLCQTKLDLNEPYAVVIADRYMPGADGLQFARALRSQPGLAEAKLVLLSPDELPADASCLVQAVAPKPVRELKLLHAIQLALGIEPPPAAAPKGPPTAPAASGKLFVLVADDNAVNLKIAKMMLEKLGHRADLANDGAEALQKIETHSYDAVLMDCQMPGVDGYEATRRLRAANKPWSRLPIIALTGNATSADRQACMDAGMDDFITKPLRAPELVAALAKATASAK